MINSDNGSCLVDEIIRGVSEAYVWPSYKTSLKKEIPNKLHKAEENKFFLIETGFEILFHEEEGATKKSVVVIQAGFDRSFNKFE
jgi:hypothetical protein